MSHGALRAQTLAPAAKPDAASPAVQAKPEASKEQSVEIKGSSADYDPRRDDTASKTVIGSAEIMKFGDTNVFDVLKRAPGVTVVGNSIRMRGLGNGYTQILVNGDRPPPGFSLDTLAPDQIERIEVIRAATAEHSMQAIAGTINIVLRSVVSKAQRDLSLRLQQERGNDFYMAMGQMADKAGNLSYFLNANLFANRYDRSGATAGVSTEKFWLPDGTLAKSRSTTGSNLFDLDGLALSSRLNWKLANGDDLNVQVRANVNGSRRGNDATTTVQLGRFSDPEYLETYQYGDGRRASLVAEVNWIAKIAGGKLDLKFNADRARWSDDAHSDLYSAGRAVHLLQFWDATTNSNFQGLNAKFNRSMFEGHALSTGLNITRLYNAEDREFLDARSDALPRHVFERFEPAVMTLAGYMQDEWNVTKNWSMYLGARWEQVRTDSASQSTEIGAAATSSRNQVLSPVAQTLYKFPDKSGRQLRLALTRTFKAPTTQQLIARRIEQAVNDQFSPDFSGNPDLRPELANGIDLTYEHFWAPGAVFSVNASARQITDYIRSRLDRDASGRWVYRPLNAGGASVRSLEVELKFPLRSLVNTAPALDLRFNVARNWSKVDAVPGPNNRLDAQVPLSASAGVDYKEGALTAGASIVYRGGGWVQISAQESQLLESRRDIETYALWKFSPRYQTRIALANLAQRDSHQQREYADASGRRMASNVRSNFTRISLNLEAKF
jgi:outer membrane receptor for ferrienterochelin and colicins